MKKLLCFLSLHAYSLGYAKCIWCGYEKKCKKHNEVLYIHGWEADEDCESCLEEAKFREKWVAYRKKYKDWMSNREDYLIGK